MLSFVISKKTRFFVKKNYHSSIPYADKLFFFLMLLTLSSKSSMSVSIRLMYWSCSCCNLKKRWFFFPCLLSIAQPDFCLSGTWPPRWWRSPSPWLSPSSSWSPRPPPLRRGRPRPPPSRRRPAEAGSSGPVAVACFRQIELVGQF